MPTLFVAQNGTEIHRSTKIAPAGCPKAQKTSKKKTKAKKKTKTGKKQTKSATLTFKG
jgi:hypothetical protein